MVTIYKPWLVLLWLLLISITCLPLVAFAKGTTELDVFIPGNQVQLGKPLNLTFTSSQTKVSLNEIDLSPLLPDFHIIDLSEPEIKNNHQQRRLHIYPRKTGSLFIPRLTFINFTTEAIAIDVTPPIDSKNNAIIDVNTSISTLSPWKKQQVLVKFEFITKAPIVVFDTPKAYSNHSDIIPLEISSEPVTHNNKQWTRHSSGWAIYPKQAGIHQLALPAIRLVRDGVTTHRFYPPLVNLNVKNLPVYIPSTMPVGKLDFKIIDKPTSPIFLNNIGKLQLKLTGYGNEPTSLPVLNPQLKSTEAISIYPPEIIVNHHSTQHGIRTEAIYDVNFKINQQGSHDFAEINLPYFDPANGTIKPLTKTIGTIYSIHPWGVIIGSILLLGLIYRVIDKLWRWMNNQWQAYIRYKNALIQISKANSPHTIKHCLKLISIAEDWPSNMTIRQWYSCSHSIQPEFNLEGLERLEQALYHNQVENINSLKNDLINMCYQRQKMLKWIPVSQ